VMAGQFSKQNGVSPELGASADRCGEVREAKPA
jgi:hypothetical protein